MNFKTTILSFFITLMCLPLIAQDAPLWMRYPAISPDGSTVVFSYQGDLYKTDIASGLTSTLTLHNAHDFMPVWSHDGQKIAFASDRYGNFDVFVMDASGGKATRVTYHSAGDFPSDFSTNNSSVIFTSSRLDIASNQQFPSGVLPELYSVSVNGGMPNQIIGTPAENARYSKDGSMIVFHDRKGYEDSFRKHHTSSVTRDIWTFNVSTGKYTQISTFNGEDRNPLFSSDQKSIYYLSESSGSLNVHKTDLKGQSSEQITTFTHHPVRYLTMSNDGTLCFSFNGEIYTKKAGADAQKLEITLNVGDRYNEEVIKSIKGDVTHMSLSPNGKEVAFITRGEVFVSSVKEGTTRRITETPEQERTVDFSPDGRSILYASERNGSWNLYQSTIKREEEKYFFNSTLLDETTVLESDKETFQPSYSPDGKEVAFLEERTALKVVNLATKEVRSITQQDQSYSYSDGDQHYEWSPDSKWFLVNFLPEKRWTDQIGLVSASGGEIKDLSESGYGGYSPRWMMNGEMMMWFSSRDGMKNHASWGGQMDVYASFFTQDAYDKFTLSKEEYEILKESEEESKKEEKEKKSDEKEEKKKDDKEKDKDKVEPITIELEGLEDRRVKLTIHSSSLSDAYVTKDGKSLFYLARFEKGYNLWKTDLRTKETKMHTKLGAQSGGGIVADKDDKNLFILSGGKMYKIGIEDGKKTPIGVNGEMILAEAKEREYLFEHVWRQVEKKFYKIDLHEVKWDFYKSEYARFLPHINNNYDFAEMLSEMLGELNASHTGARYRPRNENGAKTASLGLFYDHTHTGNGLKISEVIDKGPTVKKGSKIVAGVIIEKIDGKEITPQTNHYDFLDRKEGKNTLLSLHDPKTGERWEQTVKPISLGAEGQLRYQRWVKQNREMVEKLSGGKVGYVHVRSMNDRSYRTVYDEVLGKNNNKESLIVDTRFNGGGWLHDDLATFLNGKNYIGFKPRGQDLGNEPQFKWSKPSCVLMSESNYSDAHMFPYTYRALGIGKLIGMPVPGTGTAVWWERLQNGMVFGIPQVGMVDNEGDYLENKQLEPDIKVANDPEKVLKGQDQQIEAAVEEMLKTVKEMKEKERAIKP
ncbi:MAG: S41 family peptidase [Saprospiraceae bacterium]|nr:S41 family peptidase [Saprospiraceae bacterium]